MGDLEGLKRDIRSAVDPAATSLNLEEYKELVGWLKRGATKSVHDPASRAHDAIRRTIDEAPEGERKGLHEYALQYLDDRLPDVRLRFEKQRGDQGDSGMAATELRRLIANQQKALASIKLAADTQRSIDAMLDGFKVPDDVISSLWAGLEKGSLASAAAAMPASINFDILSSFRAIDEQMQAVRSSVTLQGDDLRRALERAVRSAPTTIDLSGPAIAEAAGLALSSADTEAAHAAADSIEESARTSLLRTV